MVKSVDTGRVKNAGQAYNPPQLPPAPRSGVLPPLPGPERSEVIWGRPPGARGGAALKWTLRLRREQSRRGWEELLRVHFSPGCGRLQAAAGSFGSSVLAA